MATLVWFLMMGLSATSVSRADATEALDLSREGWQLWQQREFGEAEEKFAKSVELNPKDADAWNGLGWAQFNGGRSTAAVESFKKCVKLSPKHPAGLNGLGQIYLMWGELGPAEKYLKKAAPNAPAAWYGLARLYLIQGDFKKAKPWVERLAEDPNNAEAQRMLEAVKNEKLPEDLKIMLQPAGKPEGAEVDEEAEAETESTKVSASGKDTSSLPQDEFTEWREQLTSAGEDSRWYVGANFGKTLSSLPGDEAYQILQPCWSQIADSVRPQILKGFTPGMKKTPGINDRFFDIMRLGLNDPNDQVREFATMYFNDITLSSVADDPETFKLWLAKWDERPAGEIALENCQRQIESMRNLDTSQVPEAMQRLSNAANDMREFTAMQKVALESGMYEMIDSWVEKGWISKGSQQLEHLEHNVPRPGNKKNDAARSVKQENVSPDDDTKFQDAWQVFFNRDYSESEKMFRSVLEKSPDNPHAMNGLGWSLLNQKKYDEAKSWLEKSISLANNHWGALTGMAAILREEGKMDEAVAIWERIAENATGPNDATIHLAKYYLEREEFAKAAPFYRQLVEWYPEEDAYEQALKQVEAGLKPQE